MTEPPVAGAALRGLCSPTDWRENVNVIRQRVDLWFSEDPDDIELAVSICSLCPARAACAEMGEGEAYGVWGGTTPADRGFDP